MIVRIRRISARSVFLVALVLYGAVGLVVGAALAVVGTVELPPEAQPTFLEGLGPWTLLLFPLAYGLLGGIAAAVAAILYNAAAAVVGGIRVEIPEIGSAGEASADRVEGDDAGRRGARRGNGGAADAETGPPERG